MTSEKEQNQDWLHWRDLKNIARASLRANLVACVVVSVLGGVIIWPIFTASSIITTSYDFLLEGSRFLGWTNAENLLTSADVWLKRVQQWTCIGPESTAGVISNVYNTIENSGGIEKAVVYALSHALFGGEVSLSIIATTAVIISLVVTFFVRVPLRISTLRFYLETRTYPDTEVVRLLYIFRKRRTWFMARARVYKYLRLGLWGPTIVMLPQKYYSYLMYDFILAENPDASPIEALRLSQTMMKGKRLHAFLLDLSFLHWYALGLVTFGLTMYFYATPYRSLAIAELYLRVRNEGKELGTERIELCNDILLTKPPAGQDPIEGQTPLINIYPLTHTGLPNRISRMDYHRDYSLVNLVLLFFCFSFIGWVWESLLSVAYEGHLVNRGTMYGPWLPIYGLGGVAALMLLKRLRDRPFLIFFAAMGVCGVIEYLSATIIYTTSGLKYWSYSGYFFNIQGRICLEGLLIFGMGCFAVIYFAAPLFDTWINKIPIRVRLWIIGILITFFALDATFTMMYPRIGTGITE
ncbi:MAG: DUF975 family protein [Propionibacteriaceae bacterium]|nr:DUF975 family protein [Propionibacteriaceae bacterium]